MNADGTLVETIMGINKNKQQQSSKLGHSLPGSLARECSELKLRKCCDYPLFCICTNLQLSTLGTKYLLLGCKFLPSVCLSLCKQKKSLSSQVQLLTPFISFNSFISSLFYLGTHFLIVFLEWELVWWPENCLVSVFKSINGWIVFLRSNRTITPWYFIP